MSGIHGSELDRLVAADPERDPARRAAFDVAAVRARVHDDLAGTPDEGRRRRVRPVRRRVALVAAVAGLMLATVTGGYAILAGGEADSLACVSASGDGGVHVINALSSSPVADCLPHLDPDDPADYGVYTDDAGTVVVAPDRQAAQAVVQAEVRPAHDLTIDTRRLELRMALDDVVTGAHGCGDVSAVVDRAEQVVADLDLPDMPVVLREPDAADDACAFAFVQPELGQVTVAIRPGDGGAPSPDVVALLDASRRMHQHIDGECLTAEQARRIVADELSGTGHEATTTVTVNPDPEAQCARVHTNAYGSAEVTIFGP